MFNTGRSSSRVRRLLRAALPFPPIEGPPAPSFWPVLSVPWRHGIRNWMAAFPGSTLVFGLAVALFALLSGLFKAGGPSLASAQSDTTAPTVSSVAVTSVLGEGVTAYGIGAVIKVTVIFSESVSVTGVPQLSLDVGTVSRTAAYDSSTNSSVVFNYTVAEGDSAPDGLSIQANKLSLNGGGIKDTSNNDAVLSHAALPAQENHKVDGIKPRLSNVYFLSGSTVSGFVTAGDSFDIVAEFTEPVYVSSRSQVQTTIDVGGAQKTLELLESWHVGTAKERFRYGVQQGDLDLDGVSIVANAMTLDGATIRDSAGNDAALLTHSAVTNSHVLVDAVLPTVSSIAITSDPGEDDTYAVGDKIEVTVTFSEDVYVPLVSRSDMPGARWPQLELNIGGEAKTAPYQSSTGANVIFAYTVQSGDTDDNGIAIDANKLSLNGGTIEDNAANTPVAGARTSPFDVPSDAAVTHAALPDAAGHKVGDSAPALTLSGDTSPEYEENGESSVATYSVSGSAATVSWSLSGDDDDDFSISTSGVLSFASSPNYEAATDADTDNQYRVTINASDGTNTGTLQVTVIVTNVRHDTDELPVITGTLQAGQTLTVDKSPIVNAYSLNPDAELNLDESKFGYTWRRNDGTADTNIAGAIGTGTEFSTYTLTADDVGKTITVRVGFLTTESGTLAVLYLISAPTGVVVAGGL